MQESEGIDMKTYTSDELAKILADHTKWLMNPGEGSRADLRYADLGYADLGSADLGSANLSVSSFSECRGLTWAQIGPVEQGRRTESVLMDIGVPIEIVKLFVEQIQSSSDDPFNVGFAAGYFTGVQCVITASDSTVS